jgi:hypothetical protein
LSSINAAPFSLTLTVRSLGIYLQCSRIRMLFCRLPATPPSPRLFKHGSIQICFRSMRPTPCARLRKSRAAGAGAASLRPAQVALGLIRRELAVPVDLGNLGLESITRPDDIRAPERARSARLRDALRFFSTSSGFAFMHRNVPKVTRHEDEDGRTGDSRVAKSDQKNVGMRRRFTRWWCATSAKGRGGPNVCNCLIDEGRPLGTG